MAETKTRASNAVLPVILIRGFGGLSVADEQKLTYQGFNEGTVYPHKRGENYIYEGMILRLLKSRWGYRDATNVVGYYSNPVEAARDIPPEIDHLPAACFMGDCIVMDPGMARQILESGEDPCRTVWVFRYYDLKNREFAEYGRALVRLIMLVRGVCTRRGSSESPRVNIIAHSMGGLIVREAIQRTLPAAGERAVDHINKVVTLGTPHRGISFQLLERWIPPVEAREELERFNPKVQADPADETSAVNFHKYFQPQRLLTVVGTNYKAYSVRGASWANRLFSLPDEYGPSYNRSDGLVKQTNAQIEGAPRTFVHKCHGGEDSLVTSREAFEIATRFFFGDVRARLRLVSAKVKRGKDLIGKSEFFLGLSVKPRGVDFDLFHQSAEAENCYGPFNKLDLSDEDPAFGWAGPNRLIWEGWFDTSQILTSATRERREIVVRLDFYVGERDLLGLGFSDNIVFRKHYYVRAVLEPALELFRHTDERFIDKGYDIPEEDRMLEKDGAWEFEVRGTGFDGVLRIEFDRLTEEA